jgi:cell division protein FtsZ
MKLLEVDEAANHIRELVDPNANIIWGSAFNPDLQGKIRVSVVATGIEQTAEQAEVAARPLNLGMSRGPVLPTSVSAPAAAPAPAPAEPLFTRPSEPAPVEEAEPAPFELLDEAEAEDAAEAPPVEAEAARSYASLTGNRQPKREPLDLGAEQVEEPAEQAPGTGQDELLLDASRLAAEDAPVAPNLGRRRGLVSEGGAPAAGGGGAGAGSGGSVTGSTLFERMANLSRGVKPAASDDEDGDDDGGASISIPRFLGRQNNQ